MPWFKVDDKLHDHRKARAAAKAAMGVWVLAGSWSADNLMNGFVPASVLTRWGTRADAKRLVDAGLWHDDEQDGERGWRFHEWEKYQPSRESVEAERAEARARMAELRANRKANKAKGSADVRSNTDRTSEEVRSAPTRPDPTVVPDGTTKSGKRRAPETPLPDSWQPNDAHRQYAVEHGLDLSAEAFRFRNHAIANDRRQRRWDATFTTWLSRAKDFAPKRPEQPVDRYLDEIPEAWR